MSDFEFLEELCRWAKPAMRYVVQPLADAFVRIGARCDVKQALVGFDHRRPRR